MSSRLLAALAFVVTLPTGAATISYFEGGVATAIPGLTGFMTTGADMDGLQVTACFSVLGCETRAWADTGATSGGVNGTGWGLSVTGDTFAVDAWSMAIAAGGAAGQLVSLLLDGRGSAFTIFDRTFGGVDGTPGSEAGRDWNTTLNGGTFVNVTYLDPTNITGNPAVGDLFQQVLVEFTQNSGPRTSFLFSQDTDNDSRRTVAEPGSLALLGIAAMALALARRRPRPM